MKYKIIKTENEQAAIKHNIIKLIKLRVMNKDEAADWLSFHREVRAELTYIKSNLSKPKNKHEKRFSDYLTALLIEFKTAIIPKMSAKEFSDWIDEEMQLEFENDILKETGEDTLQAVFSDSYYSSVQEVRDAASCVIFLTMRL